MIPSVVISYVDERKGRVAKAAFVNVSDALVYWNALPENRKRHLVMHTPEGDDITEIAHGGYNDTSWGGYYAHANALTANRPLPPRTRDRTDAERRGWEFDAIKEAPDA